MSSPNSLLHIAGGNLARPTHYDVIVSLPLELNQGHLSDNSWNILSKNVTIPTIKMDPIEYKYKGHTVPLPGVVQMEHTFQVTLILDEQHDFMITLNNWIAASDTNYTSSTNDINSLRNPFSIIKGTIDIIANNWSNKPVAKYSFIDVFPISLSGPAFSTDNVSSIMEISVDFAFSHFYVYKLSPEGEKVGEIESFINRKVDWVLEEFNTGKNLIMSKISSNTQGIRDSISNITNGTNDFFRNL